MDKDSNGPLLMAILESNDKIVEILIRNGASVSLSTHLDMAIFNYTKFLNIKALAIVKVILQHVQDLNEIDEVTYYKDTILHRAIRCGNQNIIKILVDHGSDVNAKDADSNTPLHLALTSKRTKIAQQLIEFGALLDCKNNNNETPLHICSEKGLNEIAKILIKQNVNLNPLRPSIKGRKMAPIHCAISSKKAKMVQILCENGADLDSTDSGINVKTFAKNVGNPEILQIISQQLDKNTKLKEKYGAKRMKFDDCIICCSPRHEIFVMVPCGHAKTCKTCCEKILNTPGKDSKCPVCRVKVTTYMKAFH